MPTCFDPIDIMARAHRVVDTIPLSESQRVRLFRAARSFETFLHTRALPWPDDADLVHEWVCAYLVDHNVETTIMVLSFLRLILDHNHPNPVRDWEARHAGIPLKFLLPPLKPTPRPPEARFLSALTPQLEAFVAYRKRLNRAAYDIDRTLRRFDRFLHSNQIDCIPKVDVPLLQAYRASLATMGLSNRVAHLRAVHQFMRFLCRKGETDVTGDGVVTVPLGKLRPRMAYIYTLKQIVDLLQAVRAPDDWNAHTVFTMLHLIYAAGLRLHEPIKLRIRDVNLVSGTIFIERTKFGKSRHIPIGKRALQYLRQYATARRKQFGTPSKDDRFFVNRYGSPMNPPSVYTEFRRARREAGLLKVRALRPPRVHDLRHAFAVHRVQKWYADGENPQNKLVLLSIYMGHREITYTAHYLQMGAEVLRLGGQGFQTVFEGIVCEPHGE